MHQLLHRSARGEAEDMRFTKQTPFWTHPAQPACGRGTCNSRSGGCIQKEASHGLGSGGLAGCDVNTGPALRVRPGGVGHADPVDVGAELFAREPWIQVSLQGSAMIRRQRSSARQALIEVLLVEAKRPSGSVAISGGYGNHGATY